MRLNLGLYKDAWKFGDAEKQFDNYYNKIIPL